MTDYSQYPTAPKALPSIGDTAGATYSLRICSRLLGIAGLEELLGSEGDFTFFAPTDAAFRDLPSGALEALEHSPAELRDMLSYHIVEGRRELEQMRNAKLRTIQGTLLTATVTDDGMNLDHASTCGHALQCANGLIHPIDRVLKPGFRPALSAAALAPSAWDGRRRVARAPKSATPDAAWPFVEAPAAKDSSG